MQTYRRGSNLSASSSTTIVARLRHLGARLVGGALTRADYRRELLLAVAEHFACRRVSLWRGGNVGEPASCVASLAVHGEDDAAAEGCALEAPVTVNGLTVGMLRCEPPAGAPPWRPADRAALRRVAAVVGLAVARHDAATAAAAATAPTRRA